MKLKYIFLNWTNMQMQSIKICGMQPKSKICNENSCLESEKVPITSGFT